MIKKYYIACAFCLFATVLQATTIFNEKDTVSIRKIQGDLHLVDYEWVHKGGWNRLYKIQQHPSFDTMQTQELSDSLLNIINYRKKQVGDTLTTSSFFYCWKPYFEWLKSIDPHYTVSPLVIYDVDYASPNVGKEILALNKEFNKNAKIIPVTIINVNDTLIIDHSLDPQLRYGDILLSVNDIKAREILERSYSERHAPLYLMLIYNSFATLCDSYNVEISRNGKIMKLTINGVKMADALYKLSIQDAIENNIRTIGDNIGYIRIAEFFPNNTRLIRILTKAITKFKREGVSNVVLDLRGNPGGNGGSFDRLLSLMIGRRHVDYCRSKLLKVSASTLKDYDFLTDEMIGKIVEIPEEESPHIIPLKENLFIEGLSYYVLMDRGTSSMAATFCNIMQYNDAATIVGEPLDKNAFIYGDIINTGRSFYPGGKKRHLPFFAGLIETGISTSITNENTKAQDGVLSPDIYIPYNAEVLAKGKDNMLEELIEIIAKKEE